MLSNRPPTTVTHPLPNPNTYWVLPGRLMAGEYPRDEEDGPSRAKLSKYLDSGVTLFIDLTEPGESGLKPYDELLNEASSSVGSEIEYVRLSIRDYDVPTREQMRRILDRIDRGMQDGHTVYVHCWGGVGRTGTVVACHLIEQGMSADHALKRLADLWSTVAKVNKKPESPENQRQLAFVKEWKSG